MKKLIAVFFVAGLSVLVLSAWAETPQDKIATEGAIEHIVRQQPAAARILNPRGSVNFGGDTSTVGTPTWARADSVGDGSSGSCSISTLGTAVPYDTQEFHVDTTTTYTIDATWTVADGYLHLYETAFDPNDQCFHLIALNDNGPGGESDSQILNQPLTAGVQYIVILGGWGNIDSGPYTATISSATGTPTLGTVPVELQSFSIE